MHIHLHTRAPWPEATLMEIAVTEYDELTQHGCTDEEIVCLLWRRQWYQVGGSDRVPLVRHWEFLKFLVGRGRIEA